MAKLKLFWGEQQAAVAFVAVACIIFSYIAAVSRPSHSRCLGEWAIFSFSMSQIILGAK